MTFRSIALRTLGLACALLLAGTAVPASGQTSPQQKILRYAFPVAETGFDPIQLTDLYSRIVTSHIFDGLYKYDYLARPFKIEPNTADGMPEVSPDFRVWTIKVRPGIYFADDPAFKGRKRELTAEDYVYTLKRAFDPRWKAPTYATLAELKIVGIAPLRDAVIKQKKPFDYDSVVPGLRALDRYTIRFEFETPQPRFLQTITSGDLYGAVAREVAEAYGDKMMEKPVGTGPFRLVEWRRSSRIVLERNPNFRELTYDAEPNADDADGQALARRFEGKRLPMVDRVEISIVEEQQPRWLSFLNKQHDLLYGLPAEFINLAIPNGKLAPNLQKQGIEALRVPGSDVSITVFNMDDPVVGGYTPERVALRRAISLGTNVEQEIRLIFRGQAVPAQAGIAPLTYGFDPQLKSENSEYSPARAKALLDLFGYVDRDGDGWRERPDGTPLVLEYNTQPDQLSRQRDELRRKDMAAIGIRTSFKTAKWPENLKSARAGKFMVWGVAFSSAAPDGQPALYRGYSGHVGGQNLSRFRNEAFDRIFEKMSNMPDSPERLELFHEAVRIMLAYAPQKSHVHRILTDLKHPWVIGFRRAPYWLDWWQYVDVDMDARERTLR